MKKILKRSLFLLSTVLAFIVSAPVSLAQSDLFGLDPAANVGLGTKDIRTVATSVIQSLLGLLGMLALIIILVGGFRWMTSGGNEDSVASAKKTIGAGIIGLVIIFFAYAIVAFIFNTVGGAIK